MADDSVFNMKPEMINKTEEELIELLPFNVVISTAKESPRLITQINIIEE
jgi:hypothetical protein